MDKNMKAVLQACEDKIRVGSTTFYKAFGYLPSPRKEAVYVIYAFCRIIDDATDEPEKSPYSIDELTYLFEHLDEAEGHFIWPALRWLFERFPVRKEPFHRQMEGQRLDRQLTQYQTMNELDRYCYLVAGTVGEMLLPVLHDHPDEGVVAAGIWLGKAMQIVNIIRDVGEDAERGRRYIPLELLEKHGYSELDFNNKTVNEAWQNIVKELSLLAREWFERGLVQLETYPRISGFCIEMAARMYEAILDDVAARNYTVFTSRAYVSTLTKIAILHRLLKKNGMALPERNSSENIAVS